jgi:DNA-binding response OmpR family regulator
MPDMDGYEVLRRLRSTDWGKTVPIIAVTALAMPAEIEKGMSAGFDEYLTKPLDVRRFLEVVEARLRRMT